MIKQFVTFFLDSTVRIRMKCLFRRLWVPQMSWTSPGGPSICLMVRQFDVSGRFGFDTAIGRVTECLPWRTSCWNRLALLFLLPCVSWPPLYLGFSTVYLGSVPTSPLSCFFKYYFSEKTLEPLAVISKFFYKKMCKFRSRYTTEGRQPKDTV